MIFRKPPPSPPGRRARRTPRRRVTDPRPRRPVLFLLRWMLILGIWGGLFLSCLAVYYAYDLPDPSAAVRFERRPSMTLLASDGSVLARYGDVEGEALGFEDIPEDLVHAVIAIEDRRFYTHFGLDPLGLGRAFVVNIKERRIAQGGSTITQQLAKNLFLTTDRTLKRKMQEAMLALWLERRFTKDEIITAYLNRVYLGAGTYGVSAAAQVYFNKPASALTLYESAMLAGLLKAPSRYSPLSNPEKAAARTKTVLAAMREVGFITKAEERDFLGLSVRPQDNKDIKTSVRYFTDWAVNRIDGYIGSGHRDLVVETTLDPALQDFAGTELARVLTENETARQVTQGAVLLMTPDGAVRAMIGGRDYQESQFNRAVQAQRQPGSAFKPVLYLTALEGGLSPHTRVIDEPVKIGDYTPTNFREEYAGEVTLAEALSKSMNTAAVRVMQHTGVEPVIAMARRLGITSPLTHDLSLALGSGEVSLLELTTAYAVFANNGRRVEPYAIAAIRDADGRVLYHRPDTAGEQIIGRTDLVELNDMLELVLENGTGRTARLSRPAAGKTGTSQDFRDAWFIGYTADYVAGVWMGNDDSAPMKGVTGGTLPAELWRDVMVRAHKNRRARRIGDGGSGGVVSPFSSLLDRLTGGH